MGDPTREIALLMLAHPAEALQALQHTPIAGPRCTVTCRRRSLEGTAVASVKAGLMSAFGEAPTGGFVHAREGEPLPDFTARIDRLWVEAGWVLVDADGTVHRRVAP